MPLIASDTYQPPFPLRNNHLHTVYPALFRWIKYPLYQRERLELPDGDFLDLDWARIEHVEQPDQLCILLHGLEGSASRSYMRGMARAFNGAGWDVLACNFRGCSGEPNRLLRSYHAGATEDLVAIIDHVRNSNVYRKVVLVGFSLGGNMMLKYLGEMGAGVPSEIEAAVAISVPCDLAASVRAMSEPANALYMRRFMRQLKARVRIKAEAFPGALDTDTLDAMTTFYEFDDKYTAPMHGFRDADEYWRMCSCIFSLNNIRIPTLILNAADDPFLAPACYPIEAAESNPSLSLEMPRYGGHVGFVQWEKDDLYWSERRAIRFLTTVMA